MRKTHFFQRAATGSGRPWLYTLPFIGFALGYIGAGFFVQNAQLPTPNVIGKPLHEGIQTLSNVRLGTRLLLQREEATLAEGTILEQLPRPGQQIRPNQNVFVTISTKRPQAQAPDWWGKRIKDVVDTVERSGLRCNVVTLPSTYPKGMCVAQAPTAGQPIIEKSMTMYASQGRAQLAVMPDFCGLSVAAFEQALAGKDVRAEFFHEKQDPAHGELVEPIERQEHTCQNCIIIDQQPVPGAIVDLDRTLDIQVNLRTRPVGG